MIRFLFLSLALVIPCKATLIRSNKERVLHSCVGAWDAWDYDSVNTRYFNVGRSQGGITLYMVEDGNSVFRPTRLIGNGYLWMPGQANNSASCTNATSYNIQTNFEIRVDAALDSWASGNIAAKSFNTPQRTWELTLAASKFVMALSTNGTGALPNSTSIAHGLSVGSRTNIKVTVEQIITNIVTTFYMGPSINGATWNQLGTPVTNFNTWVTNLFISDSRVYFGANAGANTAKGKFYAFQERSPIGGPLVINFDNTLSDQTGYTDTNATPNTIWTINRGSYQCVLRQPDTAGIWNPNANTSNYLACVSNSILNFSAATNGSWGALIRQHGSPGNRRVLNKRLTAVGSSGYEVRMAAAFQPYVGVGNGTVEATGNSSAPTATDHTLSFLTAGCVNSNMFTYGDGVVGTVGINRTAVTSTDSTNYVYLMASADTNNSFFAICEMTGAYVAKRTLTTNEQKRLKWEFQSRGARNASSALNIGFSLFQWPVGTNLTGTYPLAPVITTATVFTPNGASPQLENTIATHQYSHHTRIAAQLLPGGGYITMLAFSSNPTNETDGGMQSQVCFSTDKGVTWTAPVNVVPSASNWQPSQPTNIVGSRYAYPRNFTLYNGTNYLIVGVDDLVDTNGTPRGAALYAAAINTNQTIGPLFRINSNSVVVVDSKTVPAYDTVLGPPLMDDSQIYGVWGGSYWNQLQSQWIGWQHVFGTDFVEPTTWTSDGNSNHLYRFWRSAGNYVSQAYSSDRGTNWTLPYATGIPNTPSETQGMRLADGRNAILGNPVSSSGSVYRDPLFLALTDVNSVIVTNVYAIRQGVTKTPTFPGYGKTGGASYVSAVQVGNYLYVGYSLQKESIGFSRVLIPGLANNNNDQ